ncbi:heptaprenyl diphosphate synthase [Bacillus sp. HMF5848]|uniref:heptaprenyl diphosphate synthase component 1 n=1 Tax=Bacillus sp. HMF5848 TaxID=2495421 RepID=UPI000F78C6A7|nr:heptaprenyl diphosphate synthase component 1 [Bacillus sp. HMF5848]RSK27436.1 heptaprenyl diphosphate synthase [Bacillus sp. HMF5848]
MEKASTVGKLEQLKHDIVGQLEHIYIDKNVALPDIDNDRLLLLLSLLQNVKETTDEKRHNIIVAAMLVQLALDTHEAVTNERLTASSSIRERQLTVLAGDFYSGLYYRLLSHVNEIPLINVLAQAIKDINENKIKLYEKKELTQTVFMTSLMNIEASLVTMIADYFHLPNWKAVASDFLLLKRLLQQKSDQQLIVFGHQITDIDKQIEMTMEKLRSSIQVVSQTNKVFLERLNSLLSPSKHADALPLRCTYDA